MYSIESKQNQSWCIRPCVNRRQVKDIALACYGLTVEENNIKELVAFCDRNFLIEGTKSFAGNFNPHITDPCGRYILKIFNEKLYTKKDDVESLCYIMLSCGRKTEDDVEVPLLIHSFKNNVIEEYDLPSSSIDLNIGSETDNDNLNLTNSENGIPHLIRLVKFIPGKVIEKGDVISDILAYDVGSKVAQLTVKLQETNVEPPQEENCWNLMLSHQYLPEPYISSLENVELRNMCEDILSQFKQRVLPHVVDLPKQWIHGDLNNLNILQNEASTRVIGIIDFDDVYYSCRVADIAIALMHFTSISPKENGLKTAQKIFQGYTSEMTLNKTELDSLYDLVLLRYCVVVSTSNYYYIMDPGNDYLLYHFETALDNFFFMYKLGEERFMKALL